MRRILSILLLLVLGLGPAGTAIPANALASGLLSGWNVRMDESQLPACCRRDGKHHCAMHGQIADTNSETSVSSRDCCPCMPRTLASTAPTVVALLNAATSSLEFSSELRAVHSSEDAARMSDRHNWPKRGPPSFKNI